MSSISKANEERLRQTERNGRIRAVIAWVCVGCSVILIAFMAHRQTATPAIGPQLEYAVTEVQGKYVFGASTFLPSMTDELLADDLNTGSINQRLRYIVLVGELEGAERATAELEKLDTLIAAERSKDAAGDAEFNEEAGCRRVLKLLYATGQHKDNLASLRSEDRATLETTLGWHGRLALAPQGVARSIRQGVVGPAQRTFLGVIIAFGVIAPSCLLGLILLVALVVGVCTRYTRPQLPHGKVPSHLYIETFALWIIVLVILQLVADIVGARLPTTVRLLPSLLAFFASLLCLFWPCYCGARFVDVKRDIGWTTTRPSYFVPIYGVAGYLMSLPILLVGILLTMAVMFLRQPSGEPSAFDPVSGPAHPIVLELEGGNVWVLLQVLLLASVAAPIVEESMFRGVLYRHLRDASNGLGRAVSVLFSAFINSFVFAAIHPQGVVAIPALMALALAFSIAREMLDSVYPAMLMHGMSNTVVMLFAVIVFA